MNNLGPELSLELFPQVAWSGYTALGSKRAEYPGLRPTGSWTLDPSGELHGLDPDAAHWRERETGECVDLSGRHLVLAYGSNPDPSKLLDRPSFFGGDSVIGLRAAVFGWAAVWCHQRRQTDRSVVATLAPVPRRVEVHPILALTRHQLDEMDQWEGHPSYYRRMSHQGMVLLESGQQAQDVEVYLGTPEKRRALQVSGSHVLCADVPHAEVDRLVAP